MTTTTTTADTARKLTIDFWADVLCPWCYLGEHRLAQAINDFELADRIDLKIHTFQLDPDAPTHTIPTLEYLATKFGVTPSQARAMEESMSHRANAEGLAYQADRPTSNTLDMLRLIHLGNAHGLGWAYLRAMQTALFSGRDDAYAHDTLVHLGVNVGIPADEIRCVLATDQYTEAVRADHDQAISLGVRGVPFTVLGRRLGIPGAVSVEQYSAAIRRAWDDQADS